MTIDEIKRLIREGRTFEQEGQAMRIYAGCTFCGGIGVILHFQRVAAVLG